MQKARQRNRYLLWSVYVKAIEWWSLTEIVGIYEKNVVLSLLLVSGQISKMDVDLSEDFWNYCSAEMGAPEKVCSLLDNIKNNKRTRNRSMDGVNLIM